MKLKFRHWLIYFTAWIPYTLSYVAVFFVQSRRASLQSEFVIALMNVVPAALCGILVIKLAEKLTWSFHRRAWFFPAHLVFAAAYSLLWYATILLFLTVELSLRNQRFSPAWFSGYALQWQLFSGLMIYGTIISVVYVRQIAASLQIEKQRALEAERLAAEASLAALRAQLNPHFLFNTLHSLMALVRYNPPSAENALERLAEMLRYVLREKTNDSQKSGLVSLRDEWRFVENYLALEKLRLGERLTVETEIEKDALDCSLPALTLQPLVENAVKHGIAPHARLGTIRLAAQINGEKLELEVRDDGGGAADSAAIENAVGMGLRLVRRQLQIHYGERAEMTIATERRKGFTIKIHLPAQTATVRAEEERAAAAETVVETHGEEITKNAHIHAYR